MLDIPYLKCYNLCAKLTMIENIMAEGENNEKRYSTKIQHREH